MSPNKSKIILKTFRLIKNGSYKDQAEHSTDISHNLQKEVVRTRYQNVFITINQFKANEREIGACNIFTSTHPSIRHPNDEVQKITGE